MVLLWTQHEGGERIEPHELTNEVLERQGKDKENLHRLSTKKPPINIKSAQIKQKSPEPPPIEVMTVGVAVSSEKHVVTLKKVEEIIEKNKRNALTPTPSYNSSPSAPRPSPVPPRTPNEKSEPNSPTTNTILEDVKVHTACCEQSSSPSRVAIDKHSTLAPVPEDQVEGKKSSKKDKKKFYTLPRNWKSKAADFILTKGKTLCECCGKKCSGEVLRVQDKYFHITCFKCNSCKNSLAQGGFFTREKDYYCTGCYQKNFGQRCATCGTFVEGEVVSALGNTYHQKCFTCARCRQPFPTGERVTFTGKDCLCQRCLQIPVVDSQSPTRSPSTDGPKCAGCKEELVEGQALIALDQQWHIWCFKCAHCSTLLHGEYMGKDGLPYCEKDYQSQFGVKCAYCSRFISGKVLQAGDNHHFHPTCARCTKCGDPFGDGEEMYLQGTAIWHPRCGPGPTENGTILNGSVSNGHSNGHMNGDKERDFDGMSSTASETAFSRSRTPSLNGSFRSYSPYNSINRKVCNDLDDHLISKNNSINRKYSGQYRTCSPGLILREYKNSQGNSPVDIHRIYTYSYLAAEPAQGYLKRPIDPYDRPPKSPNVQHFHRPPTEARKYSLPKTNSRLGMRALVDQMVSAETPRPKSPKMNNEEPIILSHYPGGKKKNESRIERDDFPAPPFPYTDPDIPERRRRWSGSSKAQSIDEADSEVPFEEDENEDIPDDPKLKLQEQELSKISTGIGKVFLQQVNERQKVRTWKATHVDPRNASRTPAADREPGYKLRFYTGANASPSRVADHSRPWDDDEFDRGSSYRCSTGRSSATIPSYNVVSSLRQPPRPGYGFSPRNTFYRQGTGSYSALHGGDYSFSGLGEKTQSTEFSSARSDVSAGSLTEADRSALNAELCASTTYSSGLRGYSSYSPHLRRSLPNMHHMSNEPPKIYPAHLLLITNYRLPNDVDRCHLERHLSDADFEMVFHMSRMNFYRLPEWRRNDMKRRAKFF